jgi:outer membrane protein assembly factor BamB
VGRYIAAVGLTLLVAACGAARLPVRPPLFPLLPEWKTLMGDFVEPPLAADGRHIFVATRDGSVRALDPSTGEIAWQADGVPGTLAAADGTVLVRAEDGTVRSLHPRTGAERWTAATGLPGTLPPLIDGDRALVAGPGLACLELSTGRVLWTDRSGAEITAPPVVAGSRILTGEKDGTLRSRDRASGTPMWTAPTGTALAAPPLVDLARKRAYLGTTDRRILEIDLRDGDRGWRWPVGADIADHGLLLPDRVLFASYDAVLYALRRGGNLDWRAPLPSRPLSGPVLVGGYVVVACLENELVAVAPESGRRSGSFRTPAEIRTPPILFGNRIVVGLRDRSVVAYLPGGSLEAPGAKPSGPASAPVAPPVEPPPPGR